MARSKRRAGIVGALLAIVACGCSGGGPQRYPVQGMVTFNGEKVPRGWVTFLSASGEKETAELNEAGRYEIALPAGSFSVGISAPREITATGLDAFKAPPVEPYVPVRFAQPESSGLEATVAATTENQIDFPLKLPKSGRRR